MAEQSCLLSSCTGKTGAAGSNPAPSATLLMPAFVYILRNQSSGRHYIGSTTDLSRRVSDHKRGNTPSTRSRGRWELVYSEECTDLKAARKREREIKAYRGGVQFKALLERSCSR